MLLAQHPTNSQQQRRAASVPLHFRSTVLSFPSFSDLVVDNDPAIIFGVVLGNLLGGECLRHVGDVVNVMVVLPAIIANPL